MQEFLQASSVFIIFVLLLSILLTYAQRFLMPKGKAQIDVNEGDKVLEVPVGGTVLNTLNEEDIFLPSACGGKGTCGLCKFQTENMPLIPLIGVEENFITNKQASEGWHLGCQTNVQKNMSIHVPDSALGAKEWKGTVVSNRNVGTFIKEFDVKLEEKMNFVAGGYIQIYIPQYDTIYFKNFVIPKVFKSDWEHFKCFDLSVKNDEPDVRAYSMANYPGEEKLIKLNVRIATPPNPKITPGIASSYIFNLKSGDEVKLLGPFGEFAVNENSDSEMIFIGGGAGMAPLRSEIFDQLLRVNTKRKMSYWYGARSKKEIFYNEDFTELQNNHHNFQWHVALSAPLPEDHWEGGVGFIHNVLYESYLKNHETPEDCEYYLCGPPIMLQATIAMLHSLGVEDENIRYDEF